ncbi:MAG: hypothetical protein DRO05_01660 [Thermoproteota archaeon]|nr:MAG: hypothetical protein DRO05_01660 [Candidatus Korarchaeota archaeon]
MDKKRLERTVNEIEELIERAQELLSSPLDEFIQDFKGKYALKMVIVEITEAILNASILLLRKEFGVREFESYVGVIRELTEKGILSTQLGEKLEGLIRLRNLIVHRYWEVDYRRLYREMKAEGLNFVKKFVEVMRERAKEN